MDGSELYWKLGNAISLLLSFLKEKMHQQTHARGRKPNDYVMETKNILNQTYV